jgi:hypothetical protein
MRVALRGLLAGRKLQSSKMRDAGMKIPAVKKKIRGGASCPVFFGALCS